jgi:hypothetical protein
MLLAIVAQVVLETSVSGKLTSEYSGDYPFSYEGRASLSADELKSLSNEGKISEELSKKLARAFAQPEPPKKGEKPADDPKTIDDISDAKFEVTKDGIAGSFKLVRKEGPGTRTISAEVKGKLDGDGKLSLALEKAKATGTWDWGGGTADLSGKVEKLEGVTKTVKREY